MNTWSHAAPDARGKVWNFTAVLLLLIGGGVHFYLARDAWGDAPYKGALFALHGFGALLACFGVWKNARWSWLLGLLVMGGALLAYVASRTVGLPGLPSEPDAWLEPSGVLSLVAEAGFVLLSLPTLLKGGNANREVAG